MATDFSAISGWICTGMQTMPSRSPCNRRRRGACERPPTGQPQPQDKIGIAKAAISDAAGKALAAPGFARQFPHLRHDVVVGLRGKDTASRGKVLQPGPGQQCLMRACGFIHPTLDGKGGAGQIAYGAEWAQTLAQKGMRRPMARRRPRKTKA